ncbi:MAG: hypothetical protein ABIE03_00220 [Patescibacteria group bacterium]
MQKIILKYLNIGNAALLLIGITLCIVLAADNYWIKDSYSYLGTYPRGRIPFTSLLIILAVINGVFIFQTIAAFERAYSSKIIPHSRMKSLRIIFTLDFICLSIAGIIPMNQQLSFHTVGGILYFALYPFGIYIFSKITQEINPKFSRISRNISLLYSIGSIFFLLAFRSVVPVETFCIMLIAVWTFFLNRLVLNIFRSQKRVK